MTTPNIFNPAKFEENVPEIGKKLSVSESGSHKQETEETVERQFKTTGNSMRDQVRKLIFESFQGDQSVFGEKYSIAQVVDDLENEILNECKDPKSKQYRDKSRAAQIKLKGPRYEQSRLDLRLGNVDSKTFIRDDYIQGKATTQPQQTLNQPQIKHATSMGVQRAPMIVGPRPTVGMRHPGPGGQIIRPRFPGGGAPPMYRPPPVTQIPVSQVQEIQETEQRLSINQEEPVQANQLNPAIINQSIPDITDAQKQNINQIDESIEEQKYEQKVEDTVTAAIQETIVQSVQIFQVTEDGDTTQHPGSKKKIKKKKKKGKKPGDLNGEGNIYDGEFQEDQNDISMQMHVDAGQRDQQADAIITQNVQPTSEVGEEEVNLAQDHPCQNISERKDSDESFVYSTTYIKPSDLPQSISVSQIDLSLAGTQKEQHMNAMIVPLQENADIIENPPKAEEQVEISERIDNNQNNVTQQSIEQISQHLIEDPPIDSIKTIQSQQLAMQQLENSSKFNTNDSIFNQQNKEHLQSLKIAPIPAVTGKPNSAHSVTTISQQHEQSDALKRLQDSLLYKRQQKQELGEKLVHIENDCQLQTRKAAMLIEENKTLHQDVRLKDREIQSLKLQLAQNDQQNQLQMRSLENQLREKQFEVDQLKREAQKRKDKDERLAQSQQLQSIQAQSKLGAYQSESAQQLQYLQTLLRGLESRIPQSSPSFNNEGAGASNYQQQELLMESVQKEMREMKNSYESRIRELTDEVQTRMRDLQKVERKNLSLQEKNIKLKNMVQNMEVQQLSTVAGSGSNQRDLPFATQLRGVRGGEQPAENDDRMMRQGGHRNNQQYMMSGIEDEGTGGHHRNQNFGFGAAGEESNAVGYVGSGSGGATAAHLFNEGYDEDEVYHQLDISSNNQFRRGVNNNNNTRIDGISGGHQQYLHHRAEDVENDNLNEEEGEEDDEDEEYEQNEGEGVYYEGEGGNGGIAGDGGHEEGGEQDEQDADEGGLDEDEEGDLVDDEDEGYEDENTEYEGQNAPATGMLSAGAAHVLKSSSGGAQSLGGSLAHNLNQDQILSHDYSSAGGDFHPLSSSGGVRPATQQQIRQRKNNNNQNQNLEERKQGAGRRRGNRQQNQQHTNAAGSATGSGGSSNMQNPRQRNSRGRQQRSNQQHVQNISQQYAGEGIAPPSSQVALTNRTEYFQSIGDSSSHYSNNNREQAPQASQQQPIAPIQQREGGVAGGGVVHTVGRQQVTNTNGVTSESMMSAESGSTALIDRNTSQFNRGNGAQSQSSSVVTISGSSGMRIQPSSVQQIQTGLSVNNNQHQQYQGINGNDIIAENQNMLESASTAAVGALPQSRAAAPRQRQQQQNNQQHNLANFMEESKQSSGEVPSAMANAYQYSNNNQLPPSQHRGHQHYQQYHQNQQQHSISNQHIMTPNSSQQQQQYVMGGSSGEQEEESSGIIFNAGGPGSQPVSLLFNNQYGGGGNTSFERGRNPQIRATSGQEQSHHTPTRNDSRKTSGANTPNKDGADTPTMKAYRNQQQQNSYVHNLTSSHLFFNSNQEEGNNGEGNPFMQQNAQMNQQFGARGGQVNSASGGLPGQCDADVINPNLFE